MISVTLYTVLKMSCLVHYCCTLKGSYRFVGVTIGAIVVGEMGELLLPDCKSFQV